VQSIALETLAGASCCGPRRSARWPSHAGPSATGLGTSHTGAPATFSASVAAAPTAASASAAAAVVQRRWCRDCLAAVRLLTPLPSRPSGKATRLPLQHVWHWVVLAGCWGSLRSTVDWFCRAPKQVTMIAARMEGVLQDHGV